MGKLTYTDKTNRNTIVDRTQQATAEDFNELKTSVNVLYARLVDNDTINFYGDSDPLPTPVQDDVRFIKVGNNIEMQRYEAGVWTQRAILGSSVETDDFVLTTTAGRIYYLNNGDKSFMLAPSEDGKGIIVGNEEGDAYFASGDDFVIFDPLPPRVWSPRQPLQDETLVINGTYSFNIAATNNDNVKGYMFESNTAGVKYRISISTKAGILLDENVSQYDFDKGDAPISTVGTNTTDLNGTYYALKGNLYTATIQTDGPLEIQGHTFDIPGVTEGPEFYPKFDLYALFFNLKSLIRYPRWEEKTYSVDEKIWHNGDIYICNVDGAQTTDFDTNIDKWDSFSRSMRMSKQTQSSGILSGGVITQDSVTEISWTAGTGNITDYSDPTNPQLIDISWDAVSNYTPTSLATDGTTIFAYDETGSLVELSSDSVVPGVSKDYVIFGSIIHSGGQITKIIDAPGNIGYDGIGSYSDFVNFVIGPANVSGNIYGSNGTNLSIDVIGGKAYIKGSNFRNDTEVPDIITLASESPISFLKVFRLADPSTKIQMDGAATTFIDPTKYDDGSGTLQSVTAGYWTIQRIFRSRTGSHYVAYGQQEFSSKALALEALGDELFEEKDPLPLTLFRCSLVVSQSATDLSDTNQAEFFEASSFRLKGFSSASSTIPGITNPGGVNTNVQFNDNGTFGGSAKFTWNGITLLVDANLNVTGDITNSNLSGTNTGDVTLNAGNTTQETLDLTNQELNVNLVTATTDGAMSAEDKTKLDNISSNGAGDHWVSGLEVVEQDPKDQTVDYTAGTYLINGVLQTIASGGIYDLENGYGSVNHYTGMTSYQHKFVALYVDVDLVVKSIGGAATEKEDVPELPIIPIDTVCIALIEIKVDNSAVPKEIKNKQITDCRNVPAFNTDEFVKVSADDQTTGHLIDKLSNSGNVTFTIENPGVDEKIIANSSGGGSGSSIKLAVQAYQLTDVTGISSDTTVIWDDNEIDPDSAYNSSTGILTIPQSWIDDYDYMTITMSVCAGWSGADTKMTQLSMYYNNGSDTLYMRDAHPKLKTGEGVLSLLSLETAKLPLSDYTAGDYFYGLWENGAPFADMLGGHDNFIQVELTKINA